MEGQPAAMASALGGAGCPSPATPPTLEKITLENSPEPDSYTVPGILHFIQHEWSRFEMEKARWEAEKAELQARVAFLQGERKGQENLKKDLVRRIKMLEYALKQERTKYHKLKYGTEPVQGDSKTDTADSVINNGPDTSTFEQNSPLSWKEGRQLLRQYLQEVGYTDTILDVRTKRVRSMLGHSSPEHNGAVESNSLGQILNGGDSPLVKQIEEQIKRNAGSESRDGLRKSVLEKMPFLQNVDDDSDEDDDELDSVHSELSVTQRLSKKQRIGTEMTAADPAMDCETVDALSEFHFLETGEEEERGEDSRSLRDDKELGVPLAFPAHANKPFILGTDNPGDGDMSLGELADLTVTNDNDISDCKDTFRKTWNPKYTLRSHFDGIRALVFHPVEPVLITASEDRTLKLWNLQKTVPAKKSTALDVEPIYTFRGHIDPVLSLAVSSKGDQCFSGGLDGTICCWNIPSLNTDPYDTYDESILSRTLNGHTDTVWGLAFSIPKNRLISCSADGTVRLWDATANPACVSTYNRDKENGIPTSVAFVSDPDHAVASFTNGDVIIYDLQALQPVMTLDSKTSDTAANQINRVVSHPKLPITITAHDDRCIRFFDNKTGKMIHSMVAHLDAVTSLAVDPNGIFLMSGSHDCSIRLWNLDNKTCVQEITAHRKKYDEAIHDVTFHPSKAYIASAGADALAKVFV
ncbi:striatin-3-like isoform X3 [Stegostoma tigrinum]|uniref:striatin-3-like isoform X3 n=1 Tax=Stegostoma tigrinum TaxID=3053191 RepID=UPI00202AC63B|nr:striatin-3-like isoform X3 [Stegostoma tigrinum]